MKKRLFFAIILTTLLTSTLAVAFLADSDSFADYEEKYKYENSLTTSTETLSTETEDKYIGEKIPTSDAVPSSSNVWCVISPVTAINPAVQGETHTVHILIVENNVPVPAGVDFILWVHPYFVEGLTTGPNGQVTYTYPWTGGVPDYNYIEALGTYNGQSFSCSAEKYWIEQTNTAECTIDPVTATNPAVQGETHTVTVTVTQNNGQPVPEVNFILWIRPYFFDALQTGPNGQVTYTYPWTGGVPDYNYIEAIGEVNGVPFSCSAEKHWVAPEVECTLVPRFSINPVGTEHTVTGTVTFGGAPVQDLEVVFDIFGVNHQMNIGPEMTNQNGQVFLTYQSNGHPGPDFIRLSGEYDKVPFSCHAFKWWRIWSE